MTVVSHNTGLHSDSTPIYVLLNGPPKVGKSTFARALSQSLSSYGLTTIEAIANPMKHFIATALGVKYSDLKKDTPMDVLRGRTAREFLISLHEEYIKPVWGEDWFGRALFYRIQRMDPMPKFVIIDDCGFEVELDAVGERRFLVQLHRGDKSFVGDSRSYLPNPDYVLHLTHYTVDETYLPAAAVTTLIRDKFGMRK